MRFQFLTTQRWRRILRRSWPKTGQERKVTLVASVSAIAVMAILAVRVAWAVYAYVIGAPDNLPVPAIPTLER